MSIESLITEANRYKGDLKKCYDLGYDAGFNEPNMENCHFGLFATKEMSDAWSSGSKDGEMDKSNIK